MATTATTDIIRAEIGRWERRNGRLTADAARTTAGTLRALLDAALADAHDPARVTAIDAATSSVTITVTDGVVATAVTAGAALRDYHAVYERRNRHAVDLGYTSYRARRRALRTGVGLQGSDRR